MKISKALMAIALVSSASIADTMVEINGEKYIVDRWIVQRTGARTRIVLTDLEGNRPKLFFYNKDGVLQFQKRVLPPAPDKSRYLRAGCDPEYECVEPITGKPGQ